MLEWTQGIVVSMFFDLFEYNMIFTILKKILLLLLLCFVIFKKIFIRSIPSSTQEPQVCESCEVKFEVYCIYLGLNTYIEKEKKKKEK